MSEDTSERKSALELAVERREARKADARKAYEAQLAVDLEQIDALEIEHGDSNVAVIRVPSPPGLPAAVACRCPTPPELKRFRARVTPKHEKDRPDNIAAAEEIAKSCLIYPDAKTFEALCVARPGLCGQLGAEAVRLAVGSEERDLKG